MGADVAAFSELLFCQLPSAYSPGCYETFFSYIFFFCIVVAPLYNMAVMLETSLGEMVFDLHTDLCPKVAHVALEPLSMPIRPRVLPAQSFRHFLDVSFPAHKNA
jgi:hypothetical protein